MTVTNPIFIIGTERSGSNLLRLILNSHSHIFIPHPPHIFYYFGALEPAYGDFSQDSHLLALLKDVKRLVDGHIYPWEVTLDPVVLLPKVQPRDLLGVYAAFYDQYRVHSGNKPRWGCKSTFMLDQVERILGHYPQAQFIWLVRDPRDVAVSSRQSVFNPFHPYFTAELWAKQQRRALDLAAQLPTTTLFRLRYEDLLTHSEAEVKRLCAFLNEPFEEGMLRFFETDEAKKSGQLSKSWENTAKPILKNNFGKYRKQLTEAEIQAVEAAAGEVMQQLDYALDFPDQPLTITPALLAHYKRLDRQWHWQVEWNSLRHDKNHWKRWGRGLLMARIRARLKFFPA